MDDLNTKSENDQLQKEIKEYALRTLPEHRRLASRWNKLYALLTNFDFLEDKCKFLSVYDLESDYRTSMEAWQGESNHKDVLKKFEERLRLESHAINNATELLFPHLYNYLTWLDAPEGLLHLLCQKEGRKRRMWLRSLQDPQSAPLPWLLSLEGHTDTVNAVAIFPDGETILSGSSDKTIKLWNRRTGGLIRSLKGHTDAVSSLAFALDGKIIISGSRDQSLRIWDMSTGHLIRSLEGHAGGVTAIACSPDEQIIVSGSIDHTIRWWDRHTGRFLRSLEGHASTVNAVAFSPDGQIIISGSGEDPFYSLQNEDNTIKLWNAHTGQLLASLNGHTAAVSSLAFSPDGQTIVSGSYDRTIKLWERNTGQFIRSLEGHRAYVNTVAFSPDGQIIISGSGEV